MNSDLTILSLLKKQYKVHLITMKKGWRAQCTTTNGTINRLMKDAIVADMVVGFEPEIEVPHKWQIPERYHQSGFNYLACHRWEFTNLETAIRYIGRHRAAIRQLLKNTSLSKPPTIFCSQKSKINWLWVSGCRAPIHWPTIHT